MKPYYEVYEPLRERVRYAARILRTDAEVNNGTNAVMARFAADLIEDLWATIHPVRQGMGGLYDCPTCGWTYAGAPERCTPGYCTRTPAPQAEDS